MTTIRELGWTHNDRAVRWFGHNAQGKNLWMSSWELKAGCQGGFASSRRGVVAILLEGAIRIQIGRDRFNEAPVAVAEANVGDVLIMHAGLPYSFETLADTKLLLTDMATSDSVDSEIRIAKLTPNLAKSAEAAWLRPSCQSLEQLSQVPDNLLSYSVPIQFNQASGYKRMLSIKRSLDDNFRSPIRLATLAQDAGLDASYLSRTFMRALGMTPKNYLYALRREEFLRTLVTGEGSVSTRAAQSGFSDYVNLSHRIKRETGASPTRLIVKRPEM